MSVQGKKRNDWVAATLTDFGEPGRRYIIRHHYSMESMYRAWNRLSKIYSAPWVGDPGSRVWQETREGEVINTK